MRFEDRKKNRIRCRAKAQVGHVMFSCQSSQNKELPIMQIVKLPQLVSLTPNPPKFARGPKPPSGRFKFDLLSKPDPMDRFRVTAEVFVQANVSTISGKVGAVEYIIGVDGKPKNRRLIKGRFDPLDFPPNQPLTFSGVVEFVVDQLSGFHTFSIEPGKNTKFDKTTVFEIHLRITDVKNL
jgi:hypothetical protein